jgi:CDGSH-type Zn-finger protein
MKKRYLLSAILALTLGLALTALVACDKNQNHPPIETDTSAETWLCACGVGSGGKFCPECGEAKPDSETTAGETNTATEPESESVTNDPAESETEKDTAAETKRTATNLIERSI